MCLWSVCLAAVCLMFTIAAMVIYIHYLRQYGKGLKELCKFENIFFFSWMICLLFC